MQPSTQSSIIPIRQPLTAKTFGYSRCFLSMRLPALLLTLFATSALFAADAPKPDAPKGDTPAAKPAEKAEPKPAAKKKKGMGIPEIPEGVSISDGVKLQAAWVKAQEDSALKAGEEKPKGEVDKKKGGARGSADEALAKAMIKADPSLKPELVRIYLEASRQKSKDGMKGKKK